MLIAALAGSGIELRAQDQAVETNADRGYWGNISDLVDRLPTLLGNRLPSFNSDSPVHLYTRPHLGDVFHSGYFRLPVGVNAKLSERVSCNAELQGYFAHGLTTSNPDGLSSLNLGAKCEHAFPWPGDTGMSVGFNYVTPLSHPPQGFSDGYRRFQPYIATTRLLVPRWGLLGYASLGANFLQRTDLPSDFGRNQLHANSLAVTAGVTREWKGVQLALTARLASTEFTSDEGRQNFTLHPEIVVPIQLTSHSRTHILLTLGARAVWGPDGQMINTGSGVRIAVHLNHALAAEDYR